MPSAEERQRRETQRAKREYDRRKRKKMSHAAIAKAKRAWQRAVARLKRLRRVNRADQPTAHFNVREFDCHDGTKVPAAAYPALRRLCKDVLEPLRSQFGDATVLSGYRHRAYNARIGGARFSEHIYDLGPGSVAADMKFARGNPGQWANAARRLGAGGVGRYDRSGFTHVDSGPRRDWTG